MIGLLKGKLAAGTHSLQVGAHPGANGGSCHVMKAAAAAGGLSGT